MKNSLLPLVLGVAFACLSHSASGQTIVSADFSTYANADLVGQGPWVQYNTATARPLTVSGGSVSWAGGNTTDGQDAVQLFGSQIVQPESGTVVLYYDLMLQITAAGANPSYFAAINGLNTTTTSGNFQNVRLTARSADSGFQFGARVNGQTGYPYVYGSTLAFNTPYALRAEINLVAGNANDFINLYVGPDMNNLSLYATAAYASGSVTDVTLGGMLVSQFGSATVQEPGVSISSMSITLVPEPSSAALLALGALALGARRFRRAR